MAVNRQLGVKIRPQHTIVLGTDLAEINAYARHAATAIGEQGDVRLAHRMEREARVVRQKADSRFDVLILGGVAFQFEARSPRRERRSKGSNVTLVYRNRFDMLIRRPVSEAE